MKRKMDSIEVPEPSRTRVCRLLSEPDKRVAEDVLTAAIYYHSSKDVLKSVEARVKSSTLPAKKQKEILQELVKIAAKAKQGLSNISRGIYIEHKTGDVYKLQTPLDYYNAIHNYEILLSQAEQLWLEKPPIRQLTLSQRNKLIASKR